MAGPSSVNVRWLIAHFVRDTGVTRISSTRPSDSSERSRVTVCVAYAAATSPAMLVRAAR